MKKTVLCGLLCALLMGLAGCGSSTPTADENGTPWSEDWVMVGQNMGVENPQGFTLRDVKGAKKMFFTSWSAGEARPHTNGQGEEGEVYEAQLVLLLSGASSAESAQATVDEWLTMARDTYAVTDTTQKVCNGRDFTLLTYDFASDASAYAYGASAFAVDGANAISAELACQDTFGGDPVDILTDFLEHCHYAAN